MASLRYEAQIPMRYVRRDNCFPENPVYIGSSILFRIIGLIPGSRSCVFLRPWFTDATLKVSDRSAPKSLRPANPAHDDLSCRKLRSQRALGLAMATTPQSAEAPSIGWDTHKVRSSMSCTDIVFLSTCMESSIVEFPLVYPASLKCSAVRYSIMKRFSVDRTCNLSPLLRCLLHGKPVIRSISTSAD